MFSSVKTASWCLIGQIAVTLCKVAYEWLDSLIFMLTAKLERLEWTYLIQQTFSLKAMELKIKPEIEHVDMADGDSITFLKWAWWFNVSSLLDTKFAQH